MEPTQDDDRRRIARENRARMLRESEKADVRWLMSTRRGRRIIWRILNDSNVFLLSFTPDAMQTAFNEGRKAYGLRVLLSVHEWCPEQYPLMTKEANEHDDDAGNDTGTTD